MTHFRWANYDELSKEDLYEILKVRQEVFAVEQNCVYQDADDLDKNAWHLIACRDSDFGGRNILGYLRVVYPTYRYIEPSIGRVLIVKEARGIGLGKELITIALSKIEQEYPRQSVRISAQQYLERYYSEVGFEKVTEPYDEDGILHIEMVRPWKKAISFRP